MSKNENEIIANNTIHHNTIRRGARDALLLPNFGGREKWSVDPYLGYMYTPGEFRILLDVEAAADDHCQLSNAHYCLM